MAAWSAGSAEASVIGTANHQPKFPARKEASEHQHMKSHVVSIARHRERPRSRPERRKSRDHVLVVEPSGDRRVHHHRKPVTDGHFVATRSSKSTVASNCPRTPSPPVASKLDCVAPRRQDTGDRSGGCPGCDMLSSTVVLDSPSTVGCSASAAVWVSVAAPIYPKTEIPSPCQYLGLRPQ
jgi:hypothetical protein